MLSRILYELMIFIITFLLLWISKWYQNRIINAITKIITFVNVTLGIIFYCYFTNLNFYPNIWQWWGQYYWMINLFIFWFVYNIIYIIRNWSKIIHLWKKNILNKLFMILSIIMLFYLIFEHIHIVNKYELNFFNNLWKNITSKFSWYVIICLIILSIKILFILLEKNMKIKFTKHTKRVWYVLSNSIYIIIIFMFFIFSDTVVNSRCTNILSKIMCENNSFVTNSTNFKFWLNNISQHYINKLSFYNYLNWTKIPIVIIWLKFVGMALKISDINLDKNEKLKKIFNDDEVKIFNDKIFYSVVSSKASGKTHLVSKYKKEIKQISVSELFQGTSGTKSLSELLELKIRNQSLIDNFVLKLFSIEGIIKSGDNFKYLENEIIIIEDLEKLINDYDIIENSVKYHRCEEFFAYLKRIEDYFINNDNKPIIILCSAKDIWSHIKE